MIVHCKMNTMHAHSQTIFVCRLIKAILMLKILSSNNTASCVGNKSIVHVLETNVAILNTHNLYFIVFAFNIRLTSPSKKSSPVISNEWL